MSLTRPVRLISIAALAGFALLAGCGRGESTTSATDRIDSNGSALPAADAAGPNIRILFHRFNNKLVAYDVAKKAVVSEGDREGYSQYAFRPANGFFTSGDQVGRDFSLLRVKGDDITTLYRPQPEGAAGMFPLAASGSKLFVSVTQDPPVENGTAELTSLVGARFDGDHHLTVFPHVKKPMDGAIIGDVLYYTTYRESADSYDLYRTSSTSPQASPKLVKRGLGSEFLYAHDSHLYHYENHRVVGSGRSFACKSDESCFFHDDAHLFISMYINDDSTSELSAVDTRTGKQVAKVTDVIDYKVANSQITVYCEGSIKRFPLSAR
ncbi:MAG: hypothetical protein QM679_03430 [Patulibacter sp.]